MTKYQKKCRDAKIQNSRYERQEKLNFEEDKEEDLGACGSYGERLYDEGTELCDMCELSETCFAFYKHWRKKQ